MSMECSTIRDLLFELRQGRVDESLRREFASHLRECKACREYCDKLDRMLDEALIWMPAEEPGINRERIYRGVLGELKGDQSGNDKRATVVLGDVAPKKGSPLRDVSSAREEESGPFAEDWQWDQEATAAVSKKWIFAVAVAAMVALISWPMATFLFDSSVPDTTVQEGLAISDGPSEESSRFAEALRVSESVRIHPEEGAQWSLDAARDGWDLRIHSGEVIVEFLPKNEERLRFSFPGGRGEVIGTVFYVDGDHGEVGVLVGGVQVESLQGATVLVEEDQAWREGESVALDLTRRERVGRVVDPDEHRRQVEELRKARQQEELELASQSDQRAEVRPVVATNSRGSVPRAATNQPVEATRPGPARLRLEAEKALRDRDFAQAAEHYEELLKILPPRDRSAGSVRLDLARIYHRNLGDRERTAEHLRFFIETWPDDSITPQALAELCRIAEEPMKEAHCRRR